MTDPRSVEQFVVDLPKRRHSLLLFATPKARELAIRAFVEAGLAANERTLLVVHPDPPEAIRDGLRSLSGFEAAVTEGRLLVFPGQSFHTSLGEPTRASLETLHGQLVEAARKDGLAGVRALVDVTFFSDEANGGREALDRFESAVGEEFPFEFRLLCLLDARSSLGRTYRAEAEARHARTYEA